MKVLRINWLLCRAMLYAICAVMVVSAAVIPGRVGGAGRTVRVGVYQNKPKIFIDENGQASGFFIDLLNEIAAEEGWTLVYVPCQWAECLAALETGQFDLMPDVAYSPERDEKYDFHRTPVAESWSQVYAAPRAQISGFNDLAQRRVAVLKDSIQQTAFEQYMRGFGFEVTLSPTESLEEAFKLAADGSADAAIANHFFGDYYYQSYGLVKTPIVFNAAMLYYATTQGHNADLLAAIDRHLGAWRQEPNSIYYITLSRWTEKAPVYRVPQSVYWVMGLTLGLLVVAGGLILLLRRQVRARTRHLEQANQMLQKSEERYRLISMVTFDYMFSSRLEAEGQLVLNWVAGAFEKITGYTFEEYIAHGGWRAAVHPDDLAVDDRDMATLRANQPLITEIRILTKGGQVVWVRVYAHPVWDAARQELVGIYGAVQDITERKQAEEQVRANEEQLRSLTKYLQTAREEERARIAREIHDEFGQALTALKIDLSWLTKRLPPEQPVLLEKIKIMVGLLDATMQTVRRVATELRPGLLDDLGLLVAIEWQAQEFAERTGITCELNLGEQPPPFARDLNTAIFRIFQETLTNVARHAEATRLWVTIENKPAAWLLTIKDNGKGITRSQLVNPTSLGLMGMRERARAWGGEVTFAGKPGQGTQVTVSIPQPNTPEVLE